MPSGAESAGAGRLASPSHARPGCLNRDAQHQHSSSMADTASATGLGSTLPGRLKGLVSHRQPVREQPGRWARPGSEVATPAALCGVALHSGGVPSPLAFAQLKAAFWLGGLLLHRSMPFSMVMGLSTTSSRVAHAPGSAPPAIARDGAPRTAWQTTAALAPARASRLHYLCRYAHAASRGCSDQWFVVAVEVREFLFAGPSCRRWGMRHAKP
jgi:hypothetical protein